MSIKPEYLLLLAILIAGTYSCGTEETSPGALPPPGIIPRDGVFDERGEGSFVYSGYEPLKEKPIVLHYYIPLEGDVSDMPVLFSMHGSERDGSLQRDAWKYFAEEYGFIVLAPEYSKTYYTENDYQFGGVFAADGSGRINDGADWTYNTIEAIFDYFKSETGNTSATYNMFGHSAGGQFVHRFLLAMPEARVGRAVAANPGSWTFPCAEGLEGTDGRKYGWPYSVWQTPFAEIERLTAFFGRTMYIHLGNADTDENDSSLPKDAPSLAQGAHRLARGRNFFATCEEVSGSLGLPLHFTLAEVEGAGHSTLKMVYGLPNVQNPEDTGHRGENSAFNLLFE